MQQWHGHLQISACRDRTVQDKNRQWRIFPLSPHASRIAKGLQENQVLRVSPRLQQEAHPFSADGPSYQPPQDVCQKKQKKTDHHLSGLWKANENPKDHDARAG